jgi:hypothetical protein
MKTIFLPGITLNQLDYAVDYLKSHGIPCEFSATKKLGVSVPVDQYEVAQKALEGFKPE